MQQIIELKCIYLYISQPIFHESAPRPVQSLSCDVVVVFVRSIQLPGSNLCLRWSVFDFSLKIFSNIFGGEEGEGNIFKAPSLQNRKDYGPEILRQCSPLPVCHMSQVRCPFSGVRRQVSRVRCQVSLVIFLLFICFIKKKQSSSCWASQWRVCMNGSTPSSFCIGPTGRTCQEIFNDPVISYHLRIAPTTGDFFNVYLNCTQLSYLNTACPPRTCTTNS